ncbi:MAG: MarC family protein [Coxiellaceae bacterium]|nr:MarC family protein [Coxiellaceae bacterium]
MTFYSATMTLFLVMDPLGNIPVFLSVLKPYDMAQQRRIILREMVIAFAILLVFLFFGQFIMRGLGISEPALSMSGGLILFLIAINMIFPGFGHLNSNDTINEPFIVPLAVPLTAGPSAIAVVMLFVSQSTTTLTLCLSAVTVAWVVFTLVMLAAPWLMKLFKERGLIAIERLMGMLLTVMSVQMFLQGLAHFIKALK